MSNMDHEGGSAHCCHLETQAARSFISTSASAVTKIGREDEVNHILAPEASVQERHIPLVLTLRSSLTGTNPWRCNPIVF